MKAENSTNISTKPQKLLKFKELCFPDTISQRNSRKLHQISKEISFLSLLSLFLCIKFVSKTLLTKLPFESVSELENCGIYYLRLSTKTF